MLTEDDERPARPRFTPLPLDRLGVSELEQYIGELRAEIGRAEAEIARKRSHRGEADRVFNLG